MTTKIYSLQDENGNIRYIGKTIKRLSVRLSKHLSDARNGIKNHRCNWIRSIMTKGSWPAIFLIGEVEGNGCKEEIAWIKYFRDEGINLVNETNGGEGTFGRIYIVSAKTRKKLSESHKGKPNGCSGTYRSEESKRKMSESKKGQIPWNIGKHHSEETKKKLSEANKGKIVSEEIRRKISKSTKGYIKSKEHCRKLSESHRGKKNQWYGKRFSEEHKRKMSETRKKSPKCRGWKLSKDICKKMSEYRKGHKSSTETCLKISIANKDKRRSEETKMRMRIGWQKRKDKDK